VWGCNQTKKKAMKERWKGMPAATVGVTHISCYCCQYQAQISRDTRSGVNQTTSHLALQSEEAASVAVQRLLLCSDSVLFMYSCYVW